MGNSPANARVHFFHGHQLPFVPPKRRNSWSVLLVVNPATGFRPARQAPPLALRKIENECVDWDVATIYSSARPSRVERLFVLFALPAFVISLFITFGMGRFGISEVLSYMISVPLLISAWFFFVGWLIDRWRFKRSHVR